MKNTGTYGGICAQSREISILYKPAMVRALLAGHKTQTRRVVCRLQGLGKVKNFHETALGHWAAKDELGVTHHFSQKVLTDLCPYGKPGDRLLVREAHYQWGWWKQVGSTPGGKQSVVFQGDPGKIVFERPAKLQSDRSKGLAGAGWWSRNSLFMPKSATRTWLEITEVRAERLLKISETDAMAEGIVKFEGTDSQWFSLASDDPVHETTATSRYQKLWSAINGADSWHQNPLVWVIMFRNRPIGEIKF